MLKLCLPISHLIEEERPFTAELQALADVLEFRRPFVPNGLPDLPSVFHWNLGAVQESFVQEFNRQGLLEFLRECGATLFSFDLGPACERSQFILPLSPTLSPQAILDTTAANIGMIRAGYSGALAAENYNYYPTGMYEHICRPDFIARFLEDLDLGLLLDLPHAEVAAINMGLDPRAYLAELPAGPRGGNPSFKIVPAPNPGRGCSRMSRRRGIFPAGFCAEPA